MSDLTTNRGLRQIHPLEPHGGASFRRSFEVKDEAGGFTAALRALRVLEFVSPAEKSFHREVYGDLCLQGLWRWKTGTHTILETGRP